MTIRCLLSREKVNVSVEMIDWDDELGANDPTVSGDLLHFSVTYTPALGLPSFQGLTLSLETLPRISIFTQCRTSGS